MANTLWRVHYEDVAEALAVKPTATNAREVKRTQDADYGSRDWFGPDLTGKSGAAARALYASGWMQGAAKIAALKPAEVAQPMSIRRRVKRSDQGDTLDIHAVYAGNLDRAWFRAKRAARAGRKNVTIIAPINIACSYSTDQVFWRGAAVAKLADLLADAGYNVGIVGAMISTDVDNNGTIDMVHTIDLKRTDQPLDVPNLAAALAHTGFFRSVGFTVIGSLDAEINGCFGMNQPATMDRMLTSLAEEYVAHGDNAIACPYTTLDQASSEAWLTAQAAKFSEAETMVPA